MIINIINLLRREQRKASLINHLQDFDCLHRFWEGFDDKSVMPFVNISNSHKQIVKDAKERNLESVLIAEDDFRFSSKNSLRYFIDNTPESYDLYFGIIFTGTIQDKRIVHGFSGMEFYCIHKSFYDVFLSVPEKKHLDVYLGQTCHLYNFFCCDPFVAYSESGYSDNFHKQWVFDEIKLPRNLLKDEVNPI